jgi:hypothetical protein
MKPEPKHNLGRFINPFGRILLMVAVLVLGIVAYMAYESHQATKAAEKKIERDRHDAEEAARTKALADQKLQEENAAKLAAARAAYEAVAGHRRRILNNLRMISSAAQQYMLEQGVSQVSEEQLEGTATSDYIRPIATVTGETYSNLQISSTTTQISVKDEDVDSAVITFNL